MSRTWMAVSQGLGQGTLRHASQSNPGFQARNRSESIGAMLLRYFYLIKAWYYHEKLGFDK